ncbi:hypothetical protein LSH36_37g01026, partial [Paralvinella palmiformis]
INGCCSHLEAGRCMIHRESVDSRRLHGNSCSLEEEKTQPKTNNGGILPSQTDCLLTLLVLPTTGELVMSGERSRSYLTHIGSRAEADPKEESPKPPTGSGSSDRPWYAGYKSSDGSLRKSGLSAPSIAHGENNALSSAKRNGHGGSQGSVSLSAGMSPSTNSRPQHSSSTYIPIGKRLHNPYLRDGTNSGHSTSSSKDIADDQISATSRREVREAFLRGETTKYDPTLRENISSKTDREKDKERQVHHHGSIDRAPKSGPKEIIAEGYVGFVNLPNQVYRKAVKRGFEFTLMVVGESGLGKSTLINSMFLTDLYNNEYPGPSHRTKKTIQLAANHGSHRSQIRRFSECRVSCTPVSPARHESPLLSILHITKWPWVCHQYPVCEIFGTVI